MDCLRYLFVCLGLISTFLIADSPAYAQTSPSIGHFPAVRFTKQVNSKLNLSFVASKRYKKDGLLLSDYFTIFSYSITSNHRLGGGFLYRRRDGMNTYRGVINYQISENKYSHTIHFDLTRFPNEQKEYRLAYLLNTTLNIFDRSSAWYLSSGIHHFIKLKDEEFDLEWRWIMMVGYKVSKLLRIEIGPDHRFKGLIVNRYEYDLWIRSNIRFLF